MKKQRIGIIGVGGIANGAHIPGYLECEDSIITAICDINEKRLNSVGEKLQIPKEGRFIDYNDLLNSGLVDAVDICTPNHVHCEIANAAVDLGFPFSVEKPIGVNYKETLELYKNVQKTKTPSFVCFSWRYRPYTRYVRDIVISGQLGNLYHIYIRCIKNSGLWEGRKLEWRFDKEKAGTGVLGDLGSHMIDITRFFGEEFDGVYAQSGIYVTERQKEDSNEIAQVTTDDWCNINAMTKNNVPVTIALSRCATTIDDLIEFEIIGENGRVKYMYENGKQNIEICIGKIDMEGKGTHNIIPPAKYQANQSKSFINMLNGKKDEYTSEIIQGVECQKVLEAAVLSIETERYVKISELGE